jgi:hypothetical protein
MSQQQEQQQQHTQTTTTAKTPSSGKSTPSTQHSVGGDKSRSPVDDTAVSGDAHEHKPHVTAHIEARADSGSETGLWATLVEYD